jgi:raffinose/stachyose/melibiose transport system substrate-binding protein
MKTKLFAIFFMLTLSTLVVYASGQKDNGVKTTKQVTFTLAIHVANIKDQEPPSYYIPMEFMKQNPDVKIELQGTETNEHLKKMKMAAQANALPDVFWLLPGPALEMAKAGYLLDLSPYIDGTWANSFLPGMLDTYKLNGMTYGIPYVTFVTGIWYNKALFDKYGVKLPNTYEDLVEAVKTFKSNNIVTIAKGAKTNFSVWAMMTALCRYGFFDRVDNILAGKDKFDNPDFLRFFQKLDELRKLGAFPDSVANLEYANARELFVGGRAAMFESGFWDAHQFEELPFAQSVGLWWGPIFSDGVGNQKVATKIGGPPWCVSNNAKQDPEKLKKIIDFLKFYHGSEGAKIEIQYGNLPAIKYVPQIDRVKQPAFSAVLDRLNDDWAPIRTQPDFALGEALGNVLYDSINGVITGVYSPKEALDMLDNKVAEQKK